MDLGTLVVSLDAHLREPLAHFIALPAAFAWLGTLNSYLLASVVLALYLYQPLAKAIRVGAVTQNMVTFLLWGTIDAIAAVSTAIKGGNWVLEAAYVVGCLIIVRAILKAKCPMRFGKIEALSGALVVGCIIAWMTLGETGAIIASAIAVGIAGIPQAFEARDVPEKAAPFTYLGFTVANLLFAAAGKDWSVKERFYGEVCTVLTLVIAVIGMRKWFIKTEPDTIVT